MNASISGRQRLSILNAIILLAGLLSAVLLAWALFHRPEVADQLIAIFGIGATLALIYYSPLAAFLVWLFFIPFAPYFHLDLHMPAGIPDMSYTRIVGSLLAVYLLAQIALGRRKLLTLTFFELSIPFFIIPLLWSAFRAYYGWLWGVQSVFDAYLMPLLVYFIARQLIRRPDDFRALAKTLILITLIIAVAAMVEQVTGFAPFRATTTARIYSGDIRKVGSFLGNPAYISLALAVVVPLAMMLAIEKQRFMEKIGYLLAVVALEVGIFSTFNRSGLIGGLVGPLVFSILNRRLLKVLLPLLLIIGLILGLSWGSLQDSSVAGRLGSESPIDYRITALRYGLEIHKTSPIIGVGWSWFGRMASEMGFRENGINVLPSTHNSYLNFLVSGGYALLGGFLIMALGLAITLAVIGWPRRKQRRFFPLFIQAAWASYFAYFIPIAAFDNAFSIYANIIFFAIMGAAISATLEGGSFSDGSSQVRATGAP